MTDPSVCPKSDDGHIFSPHVTGCGEMTKGHYHCLACGTIRIYSDMKKEWSE